MKIASDLNLMSVTLVVGSTISIQIQLYQTALSSAKFNTMDDLKLEKGAAKDTLKANETSKNLSNSSD